jgi:putative transposase
MFWFGQWDKGRRSAEPNIARWSSVRTQRCRCCCNAVRWRYSSIYRQPAAVSDAERAIMALIDRQYLARPYYGSRRMAAWLATQGHRVNRKHVQGLMRMMALAAIYQWPSTSKRAAAHKIYPYLFGGIRIERVNQVARSMSSRG